MWRGLRLAAREAFTIVREMKKRRERECNEFARLRKTDLPAARKLARSRLVAAGILAKYGTLSPRYGWTPEDAGARRAYDERRKRTNASSLYMLQLAQRTGGALRVLAGRLEGFPCARSRSSCRHSRS